MQTNKQQYLPVAIAAAQANGLDPQMFAAQIEQESGWNPSAVSKAGATGIAQFMPGTAKQFNVDPTDPVASINAAARYMKQLKDKFGSEDLARQAYNWGEGNLAKYLSGKGSMPSETAAYNSSIAKRAGLKTDMTTDQAAQMALAEVNKGLPAGTLSQAQDEILKQQSQQNPDWVQALASLTATPQPSGEVGIPQQTSDQIFAKLQDDTAKNQDAQLAGMFSDVVDKPAEIPNLVPPAVDRYLDKILSA